MGLAPYGDKKRYQQLFNEVIEYRDQGQIFIKKFKLNTTEIDRQTGRGFGNGYQRIFLLRVHSNLLLHNNIKI